MVDIDAKSPVDLFKGLPDENLNLLTFILDCRTLPGIPLLPAETYLP